MCPGGISYEQCKHYSSHTSNWTHFALDAARSSVSVAILILVASSCLAAVKCQTKLLILSRNQSTYLQATFTDYSTQMVNMVW